MFEEGCSYVISFRLNHSYNFLSVQSFLYKLSDDPFTMGSHSLYSPPLFHLHPPYVDQMVDLDPSPIISFLKLLVVVVRLKITV